ncbi:hypothetical protein ACIPSJ_50030 [Streptomyces sp. NPDC090088]|uniref:hypothetical protein n=1 Tax=Streptomyces sp. NPDC090088 TaxID=3365944 RepID=UPI0037FE9A3B
MDPAALADAAGSALVGAMATDAWTQARAAVAEVWRRFRPERVPALEEDLDELRQEVLAARERRDWATQDALVADWRQQLHALLRRQPELAEELRRVLEDVLAPALPEEERVRVYQQSNIAREGGRVFAVQDGNLIYHERSPDQQQPSV